MNGGSLLCLFINHASLGLLLKTPQAEEMVEFVLKSDWQESVTWAKEVTLGCHADNEPPQTSEKRPGKGWWERLVEKL